MKEKILKSTFSKWPLCFTAGVASIVLYCTFTVISIIFFPSPVSPMHNFLSQLGNSRLNPHGAIFYNLALILAGLAAILFYLGLYQWYTKKKGNKLLAAALAVGFVNALSIIMTGVFSESVNYSLHVFWSFLIFISFVPVLILVNTALLTYPGFNKLISYYGFVVAVIDVSLLVMLLIVGFGPGIGPLMEWIAVFSYLVWVGLIAYSTIKVIS